MNPSGRVYPLSSPPADSAAPASPSAHRSTEQLKADATELIRRGVAANRSALQIAIELGHHGVHMSPNVVARRMAEIRAQQAGIDSTAKPRLPRQVHRVTDSLSARAWKVLMAGFAAKTPYGELARRVAELGEPVPARTIARRALEWRAEQRRCQALTELNQAALNSGLWRPAELIGFVQDLDLSPGWPERYRRKLRKALDGFIREPSGDGIRQMEGSLFLFWLATVVSQRQTKLAAPEQTPQTPRGPQ